MRTVPRALLAVASSSALVLGLAATGASSVVTAVAAPAAAADPWQDRTKSPDERAAALLAAMTFDQKMRIFSNSATATGVPELGIPPRREIDGCCGVVVTDQPTTGLPAGLSVAASLRESVAGAAGDVLGAEAWNLGYSSAATPTMDVTRSPWWGRQNEGFGEDPLVAGRMGAAQVKGVEDNDVYALVKHYVLNDQEARRKSVNEQVDERSLNEFYTRSWEVAVADSQPGAIMCSFPKINGTNACGNERTLTDVLKGRLGYQGFVSSDFDAIDGFEDYVNGADAPSTGGAGTFAGDNLRAAVLDGRVPIERLNEMVYRILRSYIASGLYDNPPPGSLETTPPASSPLPTSLLDAHEQESRQMAREGGVLMKNDPGALPLSNDIGSIAVIGGDADAYIAGSNGYSPEPARITTMLDGITERAGAGTDVTYAPGVDPVRLGDSMPGLDPVPSEVLEPTASTGSGLLEQLFSNPNFAGSPQFVNRVDQVNIRNGLSSLVAINSTQVPGMQIPVALNPFSSWRYLGTMTAPTTGTYELGLSLLGSAKLYVNDELLVDADQDSYGTQSGTLDLVAGETYDIRIEYKPDAPNQFNGSLGDAALGMLRFGWNPPENTVTSKVQAAVDAASGADVAVVVARDYYGEMADRGTLSLPQAQDDLIRRVAQVNDRTIVVLATGGPVLMPWLDDVDGVLEMWYPGQAGGAATADLLFGDYSPSAKLPITFPASEAQPGEIGTTNPFEQINVLNPVARHDEGVNVGYRGYSTDGLEPLFPFGHGLSYTDFEYGDLQVNAGDRPTISVVVTNSGSVRATETVQFYSGRIGGSPVATPERQLVGWDTVTLRPGQSARAQIVLDPAGPEHPLSYFDVEEDSWVTPQGRTTLYAGRSVGDLRTDAPVSHGPTTVTDPVVRGRPQVGSTLSCDPGSTNGGDLSYQWLRDGSVIPGQTSATLEVRAQYVGRLIACQVTDGTGMTRSSEEREIKLGPALVATDTPRIVGSKRVGRVVVANPGTWSPAARRFSYRWTVGGRVVSTSDRYRLKRRDLGARVVLTVTATRQGYNPGQARTSVRVRR